MGRRNFIIDGHLAMPGASRLRVPPPFGASRGITETIESRRASALADDVFTALGVSGPVDGSAWPSRLSLLAVGIACTVAAAWLGAYTAQRRDLTPSREPLHATAAPQNAVSEPSRPPVASASGHGVPLVLRAMTPPATPALPGLALASGRKPAAASLPSARLAGPLKRVTVLAAPAQPIAQSDRPSALARAAHRTAVLAGPMDSAYQIDDASLPVETDRAMAETTPIHSGYVAHTSPVRFELQRHTRLTD